jgi:hypothetical protein
MILEKQKEANIVNDGDEASESIGMSLDLDSAQILMQMLSKNLYSDSIGSTIRECASNALDSHRRINSDDPIIVSFKLNNSNNYEFSVEDFGIGLDDDDVKNIISKYGKSTKRNSTTELGMMGLGFKAPLAYSSSFYFVCRKDGMERKYMMYEGEDVNTIDLIYENLTDQRNGVKIIVPVKWSDAQSFYTKIQEQLAYFENVYFDVRFQDRVISNDFKIFRSDDYQYSELSKDDNLHICLDNVYYPIDFVKLGTGAIDTKIGLRFSLTDGIYPTPNREAIRYTSEAKEIILEKIKSIADEIITNYNLVIQELDDFEDVHSFYCQVGRFYEIVPNVEININQLTVFSNIKIEEPKMKNVKYLDLKYLSMNHESMFREYEVKYILNRSKFKEVKRSWDSNLGTKNNLDTNIYIYKSVIPGIKKEFFRENLKSGWSDNHLFIKKVSSFSLFNSNQYSKSFSYYNLLKLKDVERKNWRDAIKEFQSILKTYTDRFTSVDDFELPKSFIDIRKKSMIKNGKIRRVKTNGDVIVKVAKDLERYVDGKNCKFVSETWALKVVSKMHKMIIYSNHDDANNLDKLYNLTNKNPLSLITLSSREFKSFEQEGFENVISYEEFMKGKTKLFRKIVTAELINRLINENRSVFNQTTMLNKFSKNLSEKLKILKQYVVSNYRPVSFDVAQAMIQTSTDLRLFDFEVYGTYLKVKSTLEEMYFINTFFQMSGLRRSDSNQDRMFADLCKYHNLKINKEFYKKPKVLDEEILQEIENQ